MRLPVSAPSVDRLASDRTGSAPAGKRPASLAPAIQHQTVPCECLSPSCPGKPSCLPGAGCGCHQNNCTCNQGAVPI